MRAAELSEESAYTHAHAQPCDPCDSPLSEVRGPSVVNSWKPKIDLFHYCGTWNRIARTERVFLACSDHISPIASCLICIWFEPLSAYPSGDSFILWFSLLLPMQKKKLCSALKQCTWLLTIHSSPPSYNFLSPPSYNFHTNYLNFQENAVCIFCHTNTKCFQRTTDLCVWKLDCWS
jgi:hypothetical protein